MKTLYLKDKFGNIEDKLQKVKNIDKSGPDPEIASMLSSYLVVFISGIYEDVIEHLFIERVRKNNDKEIEQLVKTLVDRQFRNPKFDNIKKLVKALDPKYGDILTKIDIKNKQGLNSIVENKNQLAHTGTCNATIADVIDFHNRALEIFKKLENILLR